MPSNDEYLSDVLGEAVSAATRSSVSDEVMNLVDSKNDAFMDKLIAAGGYLQDLQGDLPAVEELIIETMKEGEGTLYTAIMDIVYASAESLWSLLADDTDWDDDDREDSLDGVEDVVRSTMNDDGRPSSGSAYGNPDGQFFGP